MNKLLILFAFLMLPFILLSQDEVVALDQPTEVKIAKHEFGLNVTSLVKRLISFNELPINDPNSYLFTYKILFSNNNALRFGLNGAYRNTEQEFVNVSTMVEESEFYDFDFRIGLLMNRRLTNRWSAYLGLDLIYGLSHNESTLPNVFEQIRSTVDISEFGGGPAIGIQFFINSKVSISTELSLYYKYIESQRKQDFNNNGLSDQVENTKRSTASLATPASLYFNFRF